MRHGDPDYKTDSLTELGKSQSKALAESFDLRHIDGIYSSSMNRAIATAQPLAERKNLDINILPWLAEIGEEGYTNWPDGKRRFLITLPPALLRTGKNYAFDYEHACEASGLNDTRIDSVCQSVEREGNAFLASLGYIWEGDHYQCSTECRQRIAVFSHNGLLRLWLSILLHIPLHIMFSSFTMTHTGVTVIRFDDIGENIVPVCLTFSDMSHIMNGELPFIHRNKDML